jgi:hypothetical protein
MNGRIPIRKPRPSWPRASVRGWRPPCFFEKAVWLLIAQSAAKGAPLTDQAVKWLRVGCGLEIQSGSVRVSITATPSPRIEFHCSLMAQWETGWFEVNQFKDWEEEVDFR